VSFEVVSLIEEHSVDISSEDMQVDGLTVVVLQGVDVLQEGVQQQ